MSINRIKDICYIEKWEGHFQYPIEDENYDQPKKVNFHIEAEILNDSFYGKHSDEESAPLFDKDGTIKGYFEDDFISFVLIYPYLYYIDEKGHQKVDRSQTHPEIHYYGNYIKETNSYIGTWEMFEEFEDEFEGSMIERTEGAWESKIVSSREK